MGKYCKQELLGGLLANLCYLILHLLSTSLCLFLHPSCMLPWSDALAMQMVAADALA